jgi:hypothetical protein
MTMKDRSHDTRLLIGCITRLREGSEKLPRYLFFRHPDKIELEDVRGRSFTLGDYAVYASNVKQGIKNGKVRIHSRDKHVAEVDIKRIRLDRRLDYNEWFGFPRRKKSNSPDMSYVLSQVEACEKEGLPLSLGLSRDYEKCLELIRQGGAGY